MRRANKFVEIQRERPRFRWLARGSFPFKEINMTTLQHNQRPVADASLWRILGGPPRLGVRSAFGALVCLLALSQAFGCANRLVGWPDGEDVPPMVTSTTPASGATGVALNVPVSASFSELMDPATVSNETFTVARGEVLLRGNVVYFGVTAIFVPDEPFDVQTLYTASISSDVTDVDGNAMEANYVWTFTTGDSMDTTRPEVSATSPEHDAVEVALDAAMTATFTEAMDPSTINDETFTLREGGDLVDGTVMYIGVTARFSPDEPLREGVRYTARVSSVASDLAGNNLAADYAWGFTTGIFTDTTRPVVNATVPARNATDVERNASVVAVFSEMMDPLTVTTASFTLMDGETTVTGAVSLVGVTATFNPDAPLLEGTVYSARITDAAADLAGNTLASDYTWEFTTGERTDTTRPQVTATVPVRNGVDVARNASVVAVFTELMDPLTISTATFRLLDGTTVIDGAVTLVGVTATFKPSERLDEGTVYDARITNAAADLAGNTLLEDYTWQFTTGILEDEIAPEVTLTSPVRAATDVAIDTSVAVTFTEVMDALTISATTFTLHDDETPIGGAVSYIGYTATFAPADDLDQGTIYTARVTNEVADLAGNTMLVDYVWVFTTGEFGDTTAPEVTSTVPVRDATGVASNASVAAVFTEAMDPMTVTTGTFTIFDGIVPVYGAVTYSGVTATFVPEHPFADETVFTATIGERATDLAGNRLAEDYTWTFTSGTAPDVTAPRVTSTVPANGALNAPFNNALTATFSESMQSTTLSTTTFRLFDGPDPVTGTVAYAGVSATFTPADPLEAFTTYTARISGTVLDLAGNAMGDEYVWSFTTGFVPDTTPPVITSTSPFAGELLVAFNKSITATFSESMAPLTINTVTFVLFDDATPVAGSVTYTGVVATFNPAVDLEPMTTYTATVRAEVTDLAGNAMGVDRTWTFQTGPIPDTQAPRVTFTVPEDDATGVGVDTSIAAIFSEEMNAATITTANFTVQQLDVVVVGTVSYTGITATFRPSVSLLPMTTYSATITTEAEDLAGNALVQNYVWNFTTGIAPDSTRPFVLSTVPEDGEVDVLRNTFVTVVFSEAMNALTVNTSSFMLEDELGVMVDGSITMIGATAVFTPDALLHASTEYTATITTEAADLAGNTLATPYVWTFETGLASDAGAPFVVETNPDDGDTDVPRNASVNATFSEAMDPATVDNVSFELRGPGTTLVDGTVSYDLLTDIATFVPANDLLAQTLYTATISTEVTDLAGNPMLLDHVWLFSTGGDANGMLPVDLGSLSSFVAVAGAGLTNSNSGGTTVLNGNVGLSPTGTCLGDGILCTALNPVINGTLYVNDAAGIAAQAKVDLVAAYVDAMSRPPGTVVNDLAGLTLAPGVYSSGSEIEIAVGGTLTLDGQGDANAVWIFQAGSAITINNGAQVLTINGARAKNVFWAAGSSSTLGSNVSFQGSILAHESNSVGVGSTVVGRLLCTIGAITLLSNTITLPPN